MSAAGIEVRTERKWRGEREVEVAESYLRQKELVGTLATGTAGLGNGEGPREAETPANSGRGPIK